MAERKTAVLRRSGRQAVLGTVINDGVSIDRRQLDQLKAVLHNCATAGAASQARGRSAEELRDHLRGQLAWISSIHVAKGERLRRNFEAIDWSR